MRSVRYLRFQAEVARLAADASVPVLLEGESGTGKSMLAAVVHDMSPRRHGPYQCVQLSALDDALAGSDLFGHVRGAYTDAHQSRTGAFAAANRGTLFLDEIGKASHAVQRKLLLAIEAGTVRPLGADRDIHVDTRVICASNVPLAHLVSRDAFLGDLYARIEMFRVTLPPLRQRRADIPILVRAYVSEIAARRDPTGVQPTVSNALMSALQCAPWPNNLRELHATIHRLFIEAAGAAVLDLAHCRGPLSYLADRGRNLNGPGRDEITAALEACGDNATLAAKLLQIDRTTLYRRRRRLATSQI